MGNKYLKRSEPISNKKNFGVEIYFYVHPETRRVETSWMFSPIGVSEWDFDEQGWVALDGSDSRGLKWQKYVVYKVDWSNEDVYPMDLYKSKKLTEDVLSKHAKLVHDEFGQGEAGNNKNLSWDNRYLASLTDQLLGWGDFLSKSLLKTSSDSAEYQTILGECEILDLTLSTLAVDESEHSSKLISRKNFLELLQEKLVKIRSVPEMDEDGLDEDYNRGRLRALSTIIRAVEREELLN